MNIVDRALAASLTAQRRIRGVAVTYVRAATSETYDDVVAIPGATEFAEQQDPYAITSFRSRDFLLAIADIGGSPPGDGDHITDESGGMTRRYDLAAETGRKPWSFLDPARQWIRLHTKLTSETTTTTTTTTSGP